MFDVETLYQSSQFVILAAVSESERPPHNHILSVTLVILCFLTISGFCGKTEFQTLPTPPKKKQSKGNNHTNRHKNDAWVKVCSQC